MTLSPDHSDGSRFERIVGSVYDCALGDAEWDGILDSLTDYLEVGNCALCLVDTASGQSSIITPRADPAIIEEYTGTWWQFDPTVRATGGSPVGTITSLNDTGRDTFDQSMFYNDFWRRSGIGKERLASNLLLAPGAFASLVVQASAPRDEIGDEAAARFAGLLPHFVRAVGITRRLRWLSRTDAMTRGAAGAPEKGIVLVSRDGRILYANEAAETILAGGIGLRVKDRSVRALDPGVDAQLQRMIDECRPGPRYATAATRLVVSDDLNAARVLVEVLPYRVASFGSMSDIAEFGACAMLVMVDICAARDGRIERLRRRFGLTRAEAALCVEMLAGDGRAAAAARCGISVNTARTHLTRIFDKTGVTRQAQLVGLVGRSLAELN